MTAPLPLSLIADDPAARAHVGRVLMPAIERFQAFLARRPDLFFLMLFVMDDAGSDEDLKDALCGGKPYQWHCPPSTELFVDLKAVPMTSNRAAPVDVSDPMVVEIEHSIRHAILRTGVDFRHCTIVVQRHVVSVDSIKMPCHPVWSERADRDVARGDDAFLRSIVRKVGNRLPDGAAVALSASEGTALHVTAHERMRMEKVRSTLSPAERAYLDDRSMVRLLRVRRIGEADRLEQSEFYPSGHEHVEVFGAHVVPLPLEKERPY
jgi:hypothetical protein